MKYYLRSIIFSLVLILICIAIISQLLMPGIRQFTQLQSQIGIDQKRLVGLNGKLNDLQTIDSVAITSMADRLLMAIPSTNYYLALVDIIKSIINQNGVALVSLQSNPGAMGLSEKNDNFVNKLTVTVVVKGNFEAIRQTVHSLENNLPLVRVSSLSFDNKIASSSASPTLIKANMELVSYWSGLPANLGKYDSPLVKLTPKDYALVSLFDNYTLIKMPELGTNNNGILPVGRENPFPI